MLDKNSIKSNRSSNLLVKFCFLILLYDKYHKIKQVEEVTCKYINQQRIKFSHCTKYCSLTMSVLLSSQDSLKEFYPHTLYFILKEKSKLIKELNVQNWAKTKSHNKPNLNNSSCSRLEQFKPN